MKDEIERKGKRKEKKQEEKKKKNEGPKGVSMIVKCVVINDYFEK